MRGESCRVVPRAEQDRPIFSVSRKTSFRSCLSHEGTLGWQTPEQQLLLTAPGLSGEAALGGVTQLPLMPRALTGGVGALHLRCPRGGTSVPALGTGSGPSRPSVWPRGWRSGTWPSDAVPSPRAGSCLLRARPAARSHPRRKRRPF